MAQLCFCALHATASSEADGAMSHEFQFETWYDQFNRLRSDLYPGRYSRMYVGDLVGTAKEVVTLARQKGSFIVAHNYVYPELQEVADAVGGFSGAESAGDQAKGGSRGFLWCVVHG